MMPDPDAIVESMQRESVRRMTERDADEYRSLMAFRVGHFQEYWNQLGSEAESRVEAEYERIEREYADSAGGDTGEGGGSESTPGVPEDGGAEPLQPTEEGVP